MEKITKSTKTLLTLCMVHRHPKILLGMKKRGFGTGRWNGFGGHVEPGEAIEAAAMRELREESGLIAGAVAKVGTLTFRWQAKPEVLEVHVFAVPQHSGEPQESDEMRPQWFAVDAIPYDAMWADDKYWLPLFLAGKKFEGEFMFDGNDHIIQNDLRII